MNTLHRLRLAAIPVIFLFARLGVADNEFPSFQPGMWSFTSTATMMGASKPRVRTVRKCANPTDDIRIKWDALALKSCKFSPVNHAGDRYSYSSFCEKKDGSMLLSKSSIIVESSSAYRVETDSHTNSQQQKEVIEAKRVGDCTN